MLPDWDWRWFYWRYWRCCRSNRNWYVARGTRECCQCGTVWSRD